MDLSVPSEVSQRLKAEVCNFMTSALCYGQNRLTNKRFWEKFKGYISREDNFRPFLFLLICQIKEQRHLESVGQLTRQTVRP